MGETANRKLYVVITAGGRGVRMGSRLAKQFLEIGGKPILRRTIEAFQQMACKPEIIVVLPDDLKPWWKEYCRQNGFLTKYIMPSGGLTRFHSVRNALKYVPEGALVAIHDGVRPFVTAEFLDAMYLRAQQAPALVPVLECVESLRRRTDSGSEAVDRSRYMMVQTPQFFHSEVLIDAYSRGYKPQFTDDASVVEDAGCQIETFPGLRQNIKITTPEDMGVVSGEIFAL